VLLVAATSVGAGAQTPPRPILGPVPLPATPVGRGLNQAYGAIVRTGVNNPAAAQRAQYDYAQAVQKARAGDRAGSLAASARAQADVLLGSPTVAAPRAYAPAQSAIAAQAARGVPIVENGPALSGDLIVAKRQLELASQVPGANLDDAKKQYRAALDDYFSGNTERSRSEAQSAFDGATAALSRMK